jgi:hypothetical protein
MAFDGIGNALIAGKAKYYFLRMDDMGNVARQ